MAITVGRKTFVRTHTEVDSVGSEANSDLHLKPFTAPVADLTPHVLTTSQLAKRLGCHERTVRRHALFTITNKPNYYSLSTDPILLVLREAGGQVLQGADHEKYCILKHGKKGRPAEKDIGNDWLFIITKPGPRLIGYIQQPIWKSSILMTK